jgi:hypothetical protein
MEPEGHSLRPLSVSSSTLSPVLAIFGLSCLFFDLCTKFRSKGCGGFGGDLNFTGLPSIAL